MASVSKGAAADLWSQSDDPRLWVGDAGDTWQVGIITLGLDDILATHW